MSKGIVTLGYAGYKLLFGEIVDEVFCGDSLYIAVRKWKVP